MTTPRGDAVGAPVPRNDAYEKVTGIARYTSDTYLPGMLHAVIVRSPVAHGRIERIETAAALAMPGVVCVVTADDMDALGVQDPFYGLAVLDQTILTRDVVRFVGEPVAAVVAETQSLAEQAAAMVIVEIAALPAVFDVEEAMTSAVRVHAERDSVHPEFHNVVARYEHAHGDVDAALSQAAFVHEAIYRVPMVSHCALEPHCSIAQWTGGDRGRLEITSSTQQPFKVRADLARMFGLRLSDVRVEAPYVGGGFGGKLLSKCEPLAALVARKARRPVRILLSAEESFKTIARHGAVIRMRTGVDQEGSLVARDTLVLLDTGAYADKGPGVTKKAAYRAKGPYPIPHFRSVAMSIYTNKVPAGAFRGFSTPQVAWAGECAVNEVAAHLGEDPLDFRRKHLLPKGGEFMPGDTPLDAELAQGITLAAENLGWDAPLPPGRGRGLATGVKDGGGGASRSEAEVRLLPDGSVEVLVGTTEIGQGALTVFAQIAAEELCCDVASVRTLLPDTAVAPFDHATEASRSTVLVGSAVQKAAKRLFEELREMVLTYCGDVGPFRLRGDRIQLGDGSESLLGDVLARARRLPAHADHREGRHTPAREVELGAMVARATHDTYVGSGPLGTPSNFYEVGHGAAEVAVDRDTGEVQLVRYVSVADVGRAINPQTCMGQDDGAAVMGIGQTLLEELVFGDGELLNPNVGDYTLPRFEDLPRDGLESVLLENGDGPGPYGAKGGGEGGIISVSSAVAAAVHMACGITVKELPMSPERIWRLVRDQEGGDGATSSL